MKISVFLLFLSLLSVVRAESAERVSTGNLADSVSVFNFIPCKDVFYTYLGRNRAELDSVLCMVKRHKEEILSGRMVLQVDSYCTSLPTEEENLDMALLRAKEVEKAITWRKRLSDRYFVVKVYATSRDDMNEVVVVRLLRVTGEDSTRDSSLSFTMPKLEKKVSRKV